MKQVNAKAGAHRRRHVPDFFQGHGGLGKLRHPSGVALADQIALLLGRRGLHAVILAVLLHERVKIAALGKLLQNLVNGGLHLGIGGLLGGVQLGLQLGNLLRQLRLLGRQLLPGLPLLFLGVTLRDGRQGGLGIGQLGLLAGELGLQIADGGAVLLVELAEDILHIPVPVRAVVHGSARPHRGAVGGEAAFVLGLGGGNLLLILSLYFLLGDLYVLDHLGPELVVRLGLLFVLQHGFLIAVAQFCHFFRHGLVQLLAGQVGFGKIADFHRVGVLLIGFVHRGLELGQLLAGKGVQPHLRFLLLQNSLAHQTLDGLLLGGGDDAGIACVKGKPIHGIKLPLILQGILNLLGHLLLGEGLPRNLNDHRLLVHFRILDDQAAA